MTKKEELITNLMLDATESEDVCNALEENLIPKPVIGDEEYFLGEEEIKMLLDFYTIKG